MQQEEEKEQNIGEYTLLKQLAKGNFGLVYIGKSNKDGKLYAIKKFFKQSGVISQLQQNEIDIMKKIQHQNVVKLIDQIEFNNEQFIVMEYCEEGDLHTYMNKYFKSGFPEEYTQKIIRSIASAFIEIRKLNIVHRDIKLANILITKDFHIKIADFGFARIAETNSMLKSICGTPITMAPEISDKKGYSEKCDIWSIGMITYQMIYGKYPYDLNKCSTKEDLHQMLKQIQLQFDPKVKVSESCKDLIKNMIVEDTQKRYNFAEFQNHPWVSMGQTQMSQLGQMAQQCQKEEEEKKEEIYNSEISQLLKSVIQNSYEYQNNNNNQDISNLPELKEILPMLILKKAKEYIKNIYEQLKNMSDQLKQLIQNYDQNEIHDYIFIIAVKILLKFEQQYCQPIKVILNNQQFLIKNQQAMDQTYQNEFEFLKKITSEYPEQPPQIQQQLKKDLKNEAYQDILYQKLIDKSLFILENKKNYDKIQTLKQYKFILQITELQIFLDNIYEEKKIQINTENQQLLQALKQINFETLLSSSQELNKKNQDLFTNYTSSLAIKLENAGDSQPFNKNSYFFLQQLFKNKINDLI